MSLVLICVVAFFASGLTFFSGFGLGTLLMPAFAIFFPLPHAIAYTAVVHLANNLFKSGLMFRHVDWAVFIPFSLFSMPAAFIGALLLKLTSKLPVLYSYTLFNSFECSIQVAGLLVGFLMLFFALFEVFPLFSKMINSGAKLGIGG